MSKYTRSGGKFTGNHTTLIPLACTACDLVAKVSYVTKITPGYINAGAKPASRTRVKITDQSDACILLKIRDNIAVQEVRVYVTNLQEGRTAIARTLRDGKINICFTKEV